jgi:hypothetical protein
MAQSTCSQFIVRWKIRNLLKSMFCIFNVVHKPSPPSLRTVLQIVKTSVHLLVTR